MGIQLSEGRGQFNRLETCARIERGITDSENTFGYRDTGYLVTKSKRATTDVGYLIFLTVVLYRIRNLDIAHRLFVTFPKDLRIITGRYQYRVTADRIRPVSNRIRLEHRRDGMFFSEIIERETGRSWA